MWRTFWMFFFAPHSFTEFQEFNSCINSRMIALFHKNIFWQGSITVCFFTFFVIFFFWIAGFIPLIPHTNFLMPKKKVQQLIRYKNMLFYRIHIGNNPIWMFFSSGKLQAVSNFYSRKQWLEICFYFYFCLFGSFHRKNVCDFIFIILCGKCGVSERVRCGSNA